MARRKKTPTPKTVREIRKKVEHDQLQMGAGKVPKDETRKLTKQVEQIKTSKTRQRVNAEEVRARKGHNIVDK